MTINQLEKLANNKNKALLYFNADYCDACHQTHPIMEQIKELKPEYIFYNLDIDDADNDEISEMLKIDYMPTLIIINDGSMRKYKGKREIVKYLASQK